MSKDILGARLSIGSNADGGQDSELRDPLSLINVAGENSVFGWLRNYHSAGGNPDGFNLRLGQARGTPAVPVALQSGDYIAEIEGYAFNGATWSEMSEIKFIVDGAVVANQAPPSRLEFWTNIVNALPTLKVTISSQGKMTTFATSATVAGFNVPHGTAPSSPVNGDIWTTSAGGLFGRINGVTQNYAPIASPTFTGTVGAAAITMTGQLKINTAAAIISTGTSDGTDNSTLEINGGGGTGTSRGAKILLSGNESTNFGDLDIDAGVGGWINLSINGVLATRWVDTGGMSMLSSLATTAGGNANGIKFGTSDVCGIFFGSGAPTITAPQGALYLRTDGSSTITRAYINTTGAAVWTPITTVG